MSDRPIQVGDLVMVVREKRCGCRGSIGAIFVVKGFSFDERAGQCTECMAITYPPFTNTAEVENCYAELPRLKRIPPLEELEGQRTEESTRDPVHNFERHFKHNQVKA